MSDERRDELGEVVVWVWADLELEDARLFRHICAHLPPRANLLGASDRHAAEIIDRPVSVPDFAATVYHALGLDPNAELRTLNDRPMPALPAGEVIEELV